MAVYFEVLVCTGFDRARAEALAAGLTSLAHPWLLRGTTTWDIPGHLLAGGNEDLPPTWWVHASPRGLSYGAPGDRGDFVEDDAEREAILGAIYDHLRGTGGFDLAAAGFEIQERYLWTPEVDPEPPDPDDFVHAATGIPLDSSLVDAAGTILSDPWWRELGKPEGFARFAPGYRWTGPPPCRL